MVFHVLNRAKARACIFGKDADYAAFERVMKETLAKRAMRILGYLMVESVALAAPRCDGRRAAVDGLARGAAAAVVDTRLFDPGSHATIG
jgi:hypothetical protein